MTEKIKRWFKIDAINIRSLSREEKRGVSQQIRRRFRQMEALTIAYIAFLTISLGIMGWASFMSFLHSHSLMSSLEQTLMYLLPFIMTGCLIPAYMRSKKGIVALIAAYLLTNFIVGVISVPFSVAGIILALRANGAIDADNALKKMEGYPNFIFSNNPMEYRKYRSNSEMQDVSKELQDLEIASIDSTLPDKNPSQITTKFMDEAIDVSNDLLEIEKADAAEDFGMKNIGLDE